jgi:cephalosporin hydroxylase
MLIDELYQRARSTPSDIVEHLELLSRLSSLCDHVTEFGVRHGMSTLALLFGRPKVLVSYDIYPVAIEHVLSFAAKEAGVSFQFCLEDVLTIQIEATDLLFIDTLHTFDQLSAELQLHAPRVRRFIVMHDTSSCGDRGGGEFGDGAAQSKAGLWPAIARFLRGHPEWRLLFYFTNNNGLTVLERSSSVPY